MLKIAARTDILCFVNTWELEHAHRIGREVQRLRKAAGLTAQQLGDRAGQLGLKMTRQAISDLENGRRRYVTTAELVILAASLNTSPVNLVYPGPYDLQVELMPGWSVFEYDAAEWFSGIQSHLFGADELITNQPDMLEKFQQWNLWETNTETLNQWRELKELIITRNNMDSPDHIAAVSRQIRSVEDRLIRLLGRPLDRDAVDPPDGMKVTDE